MAGWNDFAAANPAAVSDAAPVDPGRAAGGKKMHVEAWSDGSSRGNPGPGGYGSVLRYTDPAGVAHEREFSGGFERTTNNRMELLGAIVALEALRRPCVVDFIAACEPHDVRWHWVKGHAGHAENERCDALATAAADDRAHRAVDTGFEG